MLFNGGHADIKPDNILLPGHHHTRKRQPTGGPANSSTHSSSSSSSSCAILADFGLATPCADVSSVSLSKPKHSVSASSHTHPLSPGASVESCLLPPLDGTAGVVTSLPSGSPHPDASTAPSPSTTAPQGGAAAGTIAYSAPEVLDPGLGLLTPKADVFSLGVVLWEMLAGRRPWEGMRSQEVMCAVVLQGRRPPLPAGAGAGAAIHYPHQQEGGDNAIAAQLDPGRFPPAIVRLLEGCWEAEPHRRFDAEEVANKCRGLRKRLKLGVPLY
jgi:serine/threonine protein kinase